MKLIRLSLNASGGFVLVVILSACSDGGRPAVGEVPQPNSAERETPVPTGGGGTDAQDDGATEPEEPRANGQRVGGEMIGFTVELPEDWLNVPTDHDRIDALVEQDDIPEDLAVSMHGVGPGWPGSEVVAGLRRYRG